jgi:hypothetical protein
VKPPGEHRLARSRLTLDQDGRQVALQAAVGGEYGIQPGAHGGKPFAEKQPVGLARMLIGQFFIAAGGGPGSPAAQVSEDELLRLERLCQVIPGPEAHRLHRLFHAPECRHNDDPCVFRKRVLAQEFEALAVGQVQIDGGEVEAQLAKQAARLRQGAGTTHGGSA